MPIRQYANAPATSLAANCSNVATSITVAAVTGLPITFPFTLIIDRGEATEEAVSVTAAAGTVLTVSRGIDGTTAFAHTSGAEVVHGITAQDVREPNAHINATSGVHGTTGDLVGTEGAQTLTDKTLDLADNTVTGTKAQLNAAVSDGTIVFDPGAWTSYTPAITAGGTTGNATCTGASVLLGKTRHFWAKIVLGSTSTITGPVSITLPGTASSTVAYASLQVHMVDTGTIDQDGIGVLGTTTTVQVWARDTTMGKYGAIDSTYPFTWATGDIIEVHGTYEEA